MESKKLASITRIIEAEWESLGDKSYLNVDGYRVEISRPNQRNQFYEVTIMLDGQVVGYKSTANEKVAYEFYAWAKNTIVGHLINSITDISDLVYYAVGVIKEYAPDTLNNDALQGYDDEPIAGQPL